MTDLPNDASQPFAFEKEAIIAKVRGVATCEECGHEDRNIKPATMWAENGKFMFMFGSDADFCTACDAAWEMADKLITI